MATLNLIKGGKDESRDCELLGAVKLDLYQMIDKINVEPDEKQIEKMVDELLFQLLQQIYTEPNLNILSKKTGYLLHFKFEVVTKYGNVENINELYQSVVNS